MMQCRWRTVPSLLSAFVRRNSSFAPVVLRPYQEDCLTACTNALAAGTTRLGVSLPTGAGKTTVFISLLSRIQPPPTNENATRSLIVVNSIELARQSADQVRRMFPDWLVEIEQGAKHQATGNADVTIATYQTLSNEQRLRKFDLSTMKAVIIDEAHHAAAPSYRRLLAQFDSDITHPDGIVSTPPHKIPIIGFSATFSRHDGLALSSVFDSIVYHRDFLEMIKDEWLCDVRFTSARARMNLDNVRTNGKDGDFKTSSLANVINTAEFNELVVRSWLDRASERKSTLVFCVNIEHTQMLTQAFRDKGIDARYVYAATPVAARKELLASFKRGEFPVLLNCAILTEGADIPNIDCVILARPTRSRNLFAQMIGRGLRLSPSTGKMDCRIIDFVDNNGRVGGAISIPTLFGLDPNVLDAHGKSHTIDIEDETPQSLAKRIEKLKSLAEAEAESAEVVTGTNQSTYTPSVRSITYEDYESAWELEDEKEERDPDSVQSIFAWVNCGDDIHVLEVGPKGYIRVEPDGKSGSFAVNYFGRKNVPGQMKTTYHRPRSLVSEGEDKANSTLNDAIRVADTFVQMALYPSLAAQKIYHRWASWRRQPASSAQINYVSNIWSKHPELSVKLSTVDQLTKGKAAAHITRLRHGIMGRIKENRKKAMKAEIKAQKATKTRERESTRIGRLARN